MVSSLSGASPDVARTGLKPEDDPEPQARRSSFMEELLAETPYAHLGSSSSRSGSSSRSSSSRDGWPHRVIIELCCGRDSLIGTSAGMHSDGCLVIRITVDDDFTKEAGIKKVLEVLHFFEELPVCIWVAFPCTGGSQFNDRNWFTGTADTRVRIAAHWEVYRQLWHSYITHVLPYVSAHRQTVRQAIELPDSCAYWQWRQGGLCRDGSPQFPLQEFIEQQGLKSATCHGCCFGLRAAYGQETGKLMRKVWRIASDVPELQRYLHTDSSGTSPDNPRLSRRRCCFHGPESYRIRPGALLSDDGTHCRVQGRNTKPTEGYTESMVVTIHAAFREFACRHHPLPAVSPVLVAAPCLRVQTRDTDDTAEKQNEEDEQKDAKEMSDGNGKVPGLSGASPDVAGTGLKPEDGPTRPCTASEHREAKEMSDSNGKVPGLSGASPDVAGTGLKPDDGPMPRSTTSSSPTACLGHSDGSLRPAPGEMQLRMRQAPPEAAVMASNHYFDDFHEADFTSEGRTCGGSQPHSTFSTSTTSNFKAVAGQGPAVPDDKPDVARDGVTRHSQGFQGSRA